MRVHVYAYGCRMLAYGAHMTPYVAVGMANDCASGFILGAMKSIWLHLESNIIFGFNTCALGFHIVRVLCHIICYLFDCKSSLTVACVCLWCLRLRTIAYGLH